MMMTATIPAATANTGPARDPKAAVTQMLTAAVPGLSFDSPGEDGVTAKLESQLGRFVLRLNGGTQVQRAALAQTALAAARTSLDLGIETDEAGGALVAIATRLHLLPDPMIEKHDATVIEMATTYQSWGVDPDSSQLSA